MVMGQVELVGIWEVFIQWDVSAIVSSIPPSQVWERQVEQEEAEEEVQEMERAWQEAREV